MDRRTRDWLAVAENRVKKDDLFLTANELTAGHRGDGGRARLFSHRVPGRKFGGLCLENDRRLPRHLRSDAAATKAVDGKQGNDPKKL
jgi:hypothetical protein